MIKVFVKKSHAVLSVKEKEAKNTPKQRDNSFWYEKLKNYTNSFWYAGRS